MAAHFVPSDEVARIRGRLAHPVIDADGHLVEFMPMVIDCMPRGRRRRGGGAVHPVSGARRSPSGGGHLPTRVFFGSPPTLDRMTVMLPELLYRRLEEIGLDFALLYPTSGLSVLSNPDDELRQAAARALNTYYARVFAEYRDRLEPVAVIPTFTPDEAVAELDHAVGTLGLKAVVMSGVGAAHGSTRRLDRVVGRHARPRQPPRLRPAVGALRGARRGARVPRHRLRLGQPGVAEATTSTTTWATSPPRRRRRAARWSWAGCPGGTPSCGSRSSKAAWRGRPSSTPTCSATTRSATVDAVQMFDPARFDVAHGGRAVRRVRHGALGGYQDRGRGGRHAVAATPARRATASTTSPSRGSPAPTTSSTSSPASSASAARPTTR